MYQILIFIQYSFVGMCVSICDYIFFFCCYYSHSVAWFRADNKWAAVRMNSLIELYWFEKFMFRRSFLGTVFFWVLFSFRSMCKRFYSHLTLSDRNSSNINRNDSIVHDFTISVMAGITNDFVTNDFKSHLLHLFDLKLGILGRDRNEGIRRDKKNTFLLLLIRINEWRDVLQFTIYTGWIHLIQI